MNQEKQDILEELNNLIRIITTAPSPEWCASISVLRE